MIELPANPFEPFVPDVAQPWTLRHSGHLLRRTSFGASRESLDTALASGPAKTIESLFAFDPQHDPFDALLEQMQGLFNVNEHRAVQEWWCYRIINTKTPLQEKVALFWHDHFATSGSKVSPQHLHGQIDLFRKMGLGSFRDLLLAVGRDPAMLVWLDGKDSKKSGPNENYAREVMELFTLGIGNYSEDDVKGLSRCFTGWRIEGNEGKFTPQNFDNEPKAVFGQSENFGDEGAVDLLLSHPACNKFIAKRLLQEFVHPAPDVTHIQHYATRLTDTQWNIGIVLREMLASRLFFSDWAYRSKIKSPADIIFGTDDALAYGANAKFAREQLAKMGQSFLFPPNVKGWDGEDSWINANTLLMRYNYGQLIAQQRGDIFYSKPNFGKYLADKQLATAEAIVDHFAELLLDGQLDADTRNRLLAYMNKNEKNEDKPFEAKGNAIRSKVHGVLHLMIATPQYQLC